MPANVLKRYVPRSLYGRAALILLLPVVALQVVVSIVFIQRLFEDVTAQMTDNAGYELRFVERAVNLTGSATTARAVLDALSRQFGLETTLPDPDPIEIDSRRFYDLSGRILIPALHAQVPNVTGVNLFSDDGRVAMTIATEHGPLRIEFDRDRVSASNPHQFLVIMVLTALLMTVVAYLFLKNQLRPIKRLANAALAFGRGQSVAYHPSGALEVRSAGTAFLDMRARIERQIEQRTMMLSGISHDLRTPLTRLALEIEMLDEVDAAPMRQDVQDMRRMLDAFLAFAREGTMGETEPVDPCALIQEVAAKARRAGGEIETSTCYTGTTAPMNRLAVDRALDNLLGNALRYGNRARLSLRRTERSLVFTVEDDGPGIPPEARAEAMRAFARLDGARNQDLGAGVGLGLAIAQDVARQHGGVLRLDKSADLGGLRADLVIAL